MANPTAYDVHINTALSQISIAYLQEDDNLVAGKVFPRISVAKQSDKYFTWDRNDTMRPESGIRAPNAESQGSGIRLTSDDTYYCHVHAFHQDLDDQTLANSDLQDLKPQAARHVAWQLKLERERDWINTYFVTGKWDAEVNGVASGESWSSTGSFRYFSDGANSDPLMRVRKAKQYVQSQTGFIPNTIVMDMTVFDELALHPDIAEVIKYTQLGIGTEALLAQLFRVDNVYIISAAYASNVEGETAAYSYVGGDNMLVCYVPKAAGLMIPSAGYTFEWTGLSGLGYNVATSEIRMPLKKSTRIEGEMAYDAKLISNPMGFFFLDCVA